MTNNVSVSKAIEPKWEWREQADGNYWLVPADAPEDLKSEPYRWAPELVARFQADACVNLNPVSGGHFPDEGVDWSDVYMHVCDVQRLIDQLTALLPIAAKKKDERSAPSTESTAL